MRAEPVDILRLLPQRHPMVLVDAIETDEQGETAVAFKHVTFNEPCYAHADQAVSFEALAYPLSLHIESFGQGAAVLLSQRGFLEQASSTHAVVFGEFSDIEILGHAYPGDRLRHDIKLVDAGPRMMILSGQTRVDERVLIQFGSLKAFLVDTGAIMAEAAHD